VTLAVKLMNNSSFFELYKETLPFSIESVKPAVYPNPASDFITITELNNGLQPIVHKMQIFDVLGIEVMSESIPPTTSSHRMNVEKLPAGVYFIRIGDRVEKFVKV